jgi:hypothetical protein
VRRNIQPPLFVGWIDAASCETARVDGREDGEGEIDADISLVNCDPFLKRRIVGYGRLTSVGHAVVQLPSRDFRALAQRMLEMLDNVSSREENPALINK